MNAPNFPLPADDQDTAHLSRTAADDTPRAPKKPKKARAPKKPKKET